MTMMWRNTRKAWGSIAKSFHWLLAVLILGQFALGKIAEESRLSPFKLDAFVWHKSLGVTILLLVVLRALWRWRNPPPMAPDGTPSWETTLANAGHMVLYLLMFAVPLSGWWVSDTSRIPFKAYFVLPMPDLMEVNHSMQKIAEDVHDVLTTSLLVVVILHILAALRHHFLLHNETLRRMLPGRRQTK